MNANQNYKNDLITLSHPLMLFSVFMLLINDHVLKIHAPSAVTGKISDFAGLFFFPVLLSAILHFIFKAFHFQSRYLALISFSFTAISFSLIKTMPLFNNFAESLFSIQIILDPVDLMALIVLYPSWKLRQRVGSQKEVKSHKLSYMMLCLASFATLATSPARIPGVYNLTVFENIIYAELNNNYSSGVEESYYFYSENGGMTWEELDFELPLEVAQETGEYSKLPVTLCLLNDSNICYQTANDMILESQDGGVTWAASWSIPEEREEYFQRTSTAQYLDILDIVYLDLDGRQIIVASAGAQGVLVKTEGGAWESVQVDNLGPIILKAKSFEEARVDVQGEFYVVFIFMLFLIFVNVLVNIKNRKSNEYRLLIKFSYIFGAVLLFFALFILSPGVSLFEHLPTYTFSIGFSILQFAVPLLVLFIAILTPHQLITNTHRQAKINLILFLVAALISCGVFILWAYGIIPVYETAVRIVIGLNALLVLWIFFLPARKFFQERASRLEHDL